MPESVNKVIFELPKTLRVQNGLQLKDELRGLFNPCAKGNVVIMDEHGQWIMAQVNRQATFLKGADLVDFLEGQNSLWLELSYIGENFYRIIPAKERPNKDVNKVELLSFDFSYEPEATQIKSGFSKKSAEAVKNLKETFDSDKVKSKRPKQAQDSKAEKAQRKKEKTTSDQKTRTASVPDAKAVQGRSRVPVQKVSADLPVRKQKIPGKVKKPEEKLAVKNQESVKAAGLEPLQVLAENPPLPVENPSSQAENFPEKDNSAPVKVVFFSDRDSQLLQTVEAGNSSPLSDLFLRHRALQYSLSPGFESLMSLNLVRQIEPLDYQLRTVRHVLMNLRGRALLCDEVGMGKTVEAGIIALEYILRGLVRRVLVLAPPSLVEQWQEELRSKFNLDFMAYDKPEFKAQANPWEKFPLVIASIDTAKRESNSERVLAVAYDLVIVDEAHHLKNERSQAYQLVSKLKKKYILLLTATPVENNLEELFNLITLLFPGQLETAASFKRKYITRGDPLKPKNSDKLKQLIREVMVRNRRSETAAIGSKRSAEIVKIELSSEEMALYNRLTSFVRGYYYTEGNKARTGVSVFVLKILQREAGSSIEALLPTLEKMAAKPESPTSLQRLLAALARQAGEVPRRAKAEALLSLLPEIRSKVIVFTGFTETQRFLVRTLRAAGWQVAELHSGLRRQEKEEQVRLFAGEAEILVSTETGSEGRNLQFCHTMINYDLPWNPMRIEQRIGRIHRLGQQRDVHIYNFSAMNTIESYILELLDAKINMFQLVVGELDMILGNLQEKRDFEDLVMDIWARSSDEPGLKLEMGELGDRLATARQHYLAVKDLDDRLLGELTPEE